MRTEPLLSEESFLAHQAVAWAQFLAEVHGGTVFTKDQLALLKAGFDVGYCHGTGDAQKILRRFNDEQAKRKAVTRRGRT